MELKVPTTTKEVTIFLGAVTYCHKFVKKFSENSYALIQVLQGRKTGARTEKVQLTDAQLKAFHRLKQEIYNAQSLTMPDFSKPLYLISDASICSAGSVAAQCINKELRVISYASYKFPLIVSLHYSSVSREALGVLYAYHAFRKIAHCCQHVIFVTDLQAIVSILACQVVRAKSLLKRLAHRIWSLPVK